MARVSQLTDQPLTAPRTRSVTSYDVAREAGVSQSAVSRYFTPGASISVRTRAKILKAVNALGYQPNAIARSLITNRSRLVAVMLANIGFNPDFASALSQTLAKHGLNTLLFTLDHDSDADQVIDQLWQYRVAGVIAAVTLAPSHVEKLGQRETPIVFLNRVYADISVNTVCCDHSEGERRLVDGLWAAGHRRFALVGGPEDSQVSQARVAGAATVLRSYGVEPIATIHSDYSYDGGRRAMQELMNAPDRAEAVICANDMLAIGCIDEARHGFGLAVPADVSVVGFDGAAAGRWASYDLATIRQPMATMVEAAIEMLLARIADPALTTEKRVISGELRKGSSARLGGA